MINFSATYINREERGDISLPLSFSVLCQEKERSGGAAALLQQLLMHDYHQNQEETQIERQQCSADVIGYDAEEWRDDAGSRVGARHLYTDHCLGLVRAEVGRRGMDDTGIDRGTSKADQNEAGK